MPNFFVGLIVVVTVFMIVVEFTPKWINALIARAKKTPYYHLDGYMNRWWLVPYRQAVSRTISRSMRELPNGDIEGFSFVVSDSISPVSFRKRPLAWCIQRCGIAIRIHEILRSDLERHPHSHPWGYVTAILKNGYAEERFNSNGDLISMKYHGPGAILYRPAGSLHRLTLIEGQPVTTLFITFKKRGSWGFQVDGKIVPHREYLK